MLVSAGEIRGELGEGVAGDAIGNLKVTEQYRVIDRVKCGREVEEVILRRSPITVRTAVSVEWLAL